MTLDVILRTHDRGSAHPHPRFLDACKRDIVLACVASLVASLKASGVEHRLTILDEHSTDETLEVLRGYAPVVPLEERGFLPGLREVLKRARASRADLVYMVEDDYLHAPEAIREMVAFHEQMKAPDREIAIRPFDDANDYDPRWAAPSRVVLGRERHWRTVNGSCCTLLCTPRFLNHPTIREIWDQFAALYDTPSGTALNVHEGTTIDRAWNHMALLFSPIPGLAAHLNENAPPLFDWETLWNKYAPRAAVAPKHDRDLSTIGRIFP